MGDSGQLMSGTFPHMVSQEMSAHNFNIYHPTPLETDTFSRHCRASVPAGATFPGQHQAYSGSLEYAVSSAVVCSTHPAELKSAMLRDTLDSVVGQRQLPAAVVSSVLSLPSRAASDQCVNVCSSHGSVATHTSLSISQTDAAVTAVCTKPVSSSSSLCHQQYVPQMAAEKALLGVNVNSGNGQYSSVTEGTVLNQQLDRADDTVSRGAVKVETKVKLETSRVDVSQQLLSTDVIVDVKTEQLKHNIKSEVTSEEIMDQHIQSEDVKLSDAAVAEKPVCDSKLKKESHRKGSY